MQFLSCGLCLLAATSLALANTSITNNNVKGNDNQVTTKTDQKQETKIKVPLRPRDLESRALLSLIRRDPDYEYAMELLGQCHSWRNNLNFTNRSFWQPAAHYQLQPGKVLQHLPKGKLQTQTHRPPQILPRSKRKSNRVKSPRLWWMLPSKQVTSRRRMASRPPQTRPTSPR